MEFTKMQGTGNDFVILRPDSPDMDWEQLARKMCDRHFGIGGDGIILALPSKVADLRMRIFNSDGSEAETCGNGLRCLSKYAVLHNMVKAGAKQITIETIPGVRKIKLGYNGAQLTHIQVGIGVPKFAPSDIPIKTELGKGDQLGNIPVMDYLITVDDNRLSLTFVSMGNPHAVHFIQNEVAEYPLSEIGPQVEQHSLFPRRTNFEVARVINRQTIEMRVWERGAGETLACGTGACAAAVSCVLAGKTNRKILAHLPGGDLALEWRESDNNVYMTGSAMEVFTGDWPF